MPLEPSEEERAKGDRCWIYKCEQPTTRRGLVGGIYVSYCEEHAAQHGRDMKEAGLQPTEGQLSKIQDALEQYEEWGTGGDGGTCMSVDYSGQAAAAWTVVRDLVLEEAAKKCSDIAMNARGTDIAKLAWTVAATECRLALTAMKGDGK